MNISSYWVNKKTTKYHKTELSIQNIDEENIHILCDVGIPVISENEYYSFYPPEVLKINSFEGNTFVVIGSGTNNEKNHKNWTENVVLLNIGNGKIYFLSAIMVNLGFFKNTITLVNSNIENFLFFNMIIVKFIEKVANNCIDSENILNEFSQMITLMIKKDPDIFNQENFFWLEKLQTLSFDLMEKYQIQFNIWDTLKK